jgi:hypothetical protein
MQQLFGTRLQDDSSRRMALAEVVAHLEYLRLRNQVKRQETEASILYFVVSWHTLFRMVFAKSLACQYHSLPLS